MVPNTETAYLVTNSGGNGNNSGGKRGKNNSAKFPVVWPAQKAKNNNTRAARNRHAREAQWHHWMHSQLQSAYHAGLRNGAAQKTGAYERWMQSKLRQRMRNAGLIARNIMGYHTPQTRQVGHSGNPMYYYGGYYAPSWQHRV
jgi:hypothetical protein